MSFELWTLKVYFHCLNWSLVPVNYHGNNYARLGYDGSWYIDGLSVKEVDLNDLGYGH